MIKFAAVGWRANIDIGPVLTGYLGLLLYSAACGAIGLAASSLTSNQLIAAVVGVAILLTLSFADSVGYTLSGIIKTILIVNRQKLFINNK